MQRDQDYRMRLVGPEGHIRNPAASDAKVLHQVMFYFERTGGRILAKWKEDL